MQETPYTSIRRFCPRYCIIAEGGCLNDTFILTEILSNFLLPRPVLLLVLSIRVWFQRCQSVFLWMWSICHLKQRMQSVFVICKMYFDIYQANTKKFIATRLRTSFLKRLRVGRASAIEATVNMQCLGSNE